MITNLVICGVAFLVVALVVGQLLGLLFGFGSERSSVSEFLADRRYNKELDREWKKNGRPIVYTSIGWRPDPIYKEDGFVENPPDGMSYFGNGKTYSRLAGGGTKEYRDKFNKERK